MTTYRNTQRHTANGASPFSSLYEPDATSTNCEYLVNILDFLFELLLLKAKLSLDSGRSIQLVQQRRKQWGHVCSFVTEKPSTVREILDLKRVSSQAEGKGEGKKNSPCIGVVSRPVAAENPA